MYFHNSKTSYPNKLVNTFYIKIINLVIESNNNKSIWDATIIKSIALESVINKNKTEHKFDDININ